MTYLVGVDSGGTHTNIRVLVPKGPPKTVPEIDGSLTANRSNAELQEISGEIFSAIHGHIGRDPACVWIGAAGYSAATRHRLEHLVAHAIVDLNMRVGISNDGVALLLAHDSELVTIIAGTGSAAKARNPAGQVITRGGDEWVATDYGSAFWIGLNGIRAAYRAFEGGPDTAMSNSLLKHFSRLKDNDTKRENRVVVKEIARKLASLGTDTKPTIASFAPEVTRQAELGDDEAEKIVRQAGRDLAGAAVQVYLELTTQAEGRLVAPRFLLSGSVGFRSPFYFGAFRESLDQLLSDMRGSTGRQIELSCQLNGLSETLTLAGYLAEKKDIPALDDQHPFCIQSSSTYKPN
jgi:N-acetylglucosamine kinase-like BadF-type ATPase